MRRSSARIPAVRVSPRASDRESHAFEQQRRRGSSGTITSREFTPAMFSTMCWMASVSMSRSSPRRPSRVSRSARPRPNRADAHEVAPGHVVVGSSEKTSTSTIFALTITDRPHSCPGVEPRLYRCASSNFSSPAARAISPSRYCARTQVAFQHRTTMPTSCAYSSSTAARRTGLAVAQCIAGRPYIYLWRSTPGEVEFAGPQGSPRDEVEHAALHHHRSVGPKYCDPSRVRCASTARGKCSRRTTIHDRSCRP